MADCRPFFANRLLYQGVAKTRPQTSGSGINCIGADVNIGASALT